MHWWIHFIGCWCINSIGDGHGKWRINNIKYSSFSIYFISSWLVVTPGVKPVCVLNSNICCRGKYEICNPNKSDSAVALYMDLRYETFSECKNPCTKMKVSAKYNFKLKDQEKQLVTIRFPTEVKLSVETVTKSLFSTSKINKIHIFLSLMFRICIKYFLLLVAEIGGFLGMILGVSILDLEVVIKIVLSMLQDPKRKLGFQ